MQKTRIAINGLGRIGRLLLKLLTNNNNIEIVAVNDIAPIDTLAYLLKYDTAHGIFNKKIETNTTNLQIDEKNINCYSIADTTLLPWQNLEIDIVIDCSGQFRTLKKAQQHILAGAKKVIISAPAEEQIKTIVLGINDAILDSNDVVISNASCTTHCMAPMVKIMNDNFGIQNAIMSTVHAYTSDQKLHDSMHISDLRRARAAAQNIAPTTSTALQTLEWVMPEIKNKIIGGAVRVPVIVGSLTELYCNLEKDVSIKTINNLFKNEAENIFKNILGYTEDAIVSSDIIHNPLSCLLDAGLTTKIGNLVKIVGWYDNEFGYANRLAELIEKIATLKD